MEKVIYGLAADFEAVHWNRKGENVEYFHVEPSTVQYAENVAFTLEHKPKQTITTTKNEENGQLIIVQKGPLLLFKFIPTTKDGERIYRYVKQRKLRQCSYIFRKLASLRDVRTEGKASWAIDPGETIMINHGAVYEICLTNTPRDKNTFVTTDANHPLLKSIEWKTNVELAATDYWKEEVKLAELDEQLERLERDLARSHRKTKKLLKKRGILI
ncbi:HK97 family phage prohead protease [Lysinibacillus sp. ZYM-1]|uniref:HK97 family phage prohead protease n=1 Tax=Lysinibacillus sp. ZYM-1 TaxID=1681184 RepID=UPI0006CE6DAB|nr:HK97 family phage prohead protease [Lysinibacillus sp. ZYM-1]KPN97746.1 hypothetical protein AO843_11290 [Lysinibacillus sp. ZYM-1]